MDFKNTFEKYGVFIEYVTPIIYFEKFLNISSGFTPDVAKTIIQRSDICRQNSLLAQHQSLLLPEENEKKENDVKEEPKLNKRLFMMIGVFAVLIVIMILMFLHMNAINNADKQKAALRAAAQKIVSPVSSPTPVITEAVSSSSAELIDTNISIQIQSNEQSGTNAATLKENLKALGFTKVVSDTSQTTVPQNTQIVVLNSVPDSTREKILTTVQAIYTNASVKETTQSEADVVIVLGKK